MELLLIYFGMWIPIGLLWRFTDWFEDLIYDATKLETPASVMMGWPLILFIFTVTGPFVGIWYFVNWIMGN